MSHKTPTPQQPQSATLRDEVPARTHSSAQTVADPDQGAAVCAIRPHPLAATNPHLHATPPDLQVRDANWSWSLLYAAYLTHTDNGPRLRHSDQIHGNAFEWALAESRATDSARQVLLKLIWRWETTDDPPTWPGYRWLLDNTDTTRIEDVEEAVLELIVLGELSLDPRAIAEGRDLDLADPCPTVACFLPAWQTWLAADTPAAVTE